MAPSMRRSVPLPWSPAGGLDTFFSYTAALSEAQRRGGERAGALQGGVQAAVGAAKVERHRAALEEEAVLRGRLAALKHNRSRHELNALCEGVTADRERRLQVRVGAALEGKQRREDAALLASLRAMERESGGGGGGGPHQQQQQQQQPLQGSAPPHPGTLNVRALEQYVAAQGAGFKRGAGAGEL